MNAIKGKRKNYLQKINKGSFVRVPIFQSVALVVVAPFVFAAFAQIHRNVLLLLLL